MLRGSALSMWSNHTTRVWQARPGWPSKIHRTWLAAHWCDWHANSVNKFSFILWWFQLFTEQNGKTRWFFRYLERPCVQNFYCCLKYLNFSRFRAKVAFRRKSAVCQPRQNVKGMYGWGKSVFWSAKNAVWFSRVKTQFLKHKCVHISDQRAMVGKNNARSQKKIIAFGLKQHFLLKKQGKMQPFEDAGINAVGSEFKVVMGQTLGTLVNSKIACNGDFLPKRK